MTSRSQTIVENEENARVSGRFLCAGACLWCSIPSCAEGTGCQPLAEQPVAPGVGIAKAGHPAWNWLLMDVSMTPSVTTSW